jgi:hypothetical protein
MLTARLNPVAADRVSLTPLTNPACSVSRAPGTRVEVGVQLGVAEAVAVKVEDGRGVPVGLGPNVAVGLGVRVGGPYVGVA